MPWDDSAEDYYEGPDVQVELVCGGLRASTTLPAYIADAERLAPLFREIDRDWRGWDGGKKAGDPGRDWLSVSASHDGSGHVRLSIHLADGWPMETAWSVNAELTIDVGTAPDIATKLERWQAAIWPTEKRWRTPAP